MATAHDPITITAQCLCKAHVFTATLPASQLPLKATYCHCTSCRHLTGALHSSDILWPGPAEDILASGLRYYQTTPRTALRFCGTCFAPLFFQEQPDRPGGPPVFDVLTGALAHQPNPELTGLVEIRNHMYLADTVDGGDSLWLRTPNASGTVPSLWAGQKDTSERLPADWPGGVAPKPPAGGPGDIPIRCHCGGVDLVYRRKACLDDMARKPRDQLPWFIDPDTRKTLTVLDVCDSCRSSSGTDMFYWTFTHLAHLAFADPAADKGAFPATSPELRRAVEEEGGNGRFGTLVVYASSATVQRYHCSRCSAAVFAGVEDRIDFVDIAVGMLDYPEGARAEGMLSWKYGEKFAWRENVAGGWREGLIERAEEECDAWRRERGWPTCWLHS